MVNANAKKTISVVAVAIVAALRCGHRVQDVIAWENLAKDRLLSRSRKRNVNVNASSISFIILAIKTAAIVAVAVAVIMAEARFLQKKITVVKSLLVRKVKTNRKGK